MVAVFESLFYLSKLQFLYRVEQEQKYKAQRDTKKEAWLEKRREKSWGPKVVVQGEEQ